MRTWFPFCCAVSRAGDVAVAGSFALLTIGANLTSNGGSDAFVAKLRGSDLTPAMNGISWGGTGNDIASGVGFTSAGDMVVVGSVSASTAAFRSANGGHDTAGAVALDATSISAPDAFVVKINGATGLVDGGTTYGSGHTTIGETVAVNRFSPGNEVAFSGQLVFLGPVSFGSAGTITAVNTTDMFVVFGDVH